MGQGQGRRRGRFFHRQEMVALRCKIVGHDNLFPSKTATKVICAAGPPASLLAASGGGAASRRHRELPPVVPHRSMAGAHVVDLLNGIPDAVLDLIGASREGDIAAVCALLDAGAADGVNAAYPPEAGGWTALMSAADAGHSHVVARLLAVPGIQVDLRDTGGRTALLWGSNQPDAAVVRLLVRAGANVNAGDEDAWTPLMCAAQGGHTSIAEVLLGAGADAGAHRFAGAGPWPSWPTTALVDAAINGHTSIVQLLLQRAGKVVRRPVAHALLVAATAGLAPTVELLLTALPVKRRVKGAAVQAALRAAVRAGHASIVEMLLGKRGVDPNDLFDDWGTLLMSAARRGHLAVVSLLLAAGAHVDMCTERRDWTPLMEAAASGHAAVVHVLRAAGAKVDCVCTASYGRHSPLHIAASDGHATVVQALLASGATAGADVNKTCSSGVTSLMVASAAGHLHVVNMLLAAGAAVDMVATLGGDTALTWAASRGCTTVVSALLAAGAAVDQPNAGGKTPLSQACAWGHTAVVHVLLAGGADVLRANPDGHTVLAEAAGFAWPGVVRALLAHHCIHDCVATAEAGIGGDAAEVDAEEAARAAREEEEQMEDLGLSVQAVTEGPADQRTLAVISEFTRWHAAQAVCAAARAPPPERGVAPLQAASPALVAALEASQQAGVSAEALSVARTTDGFTALGGAVAAAGARDWTARALLAAGISALVPGNLEGTSVGALAARAGHRAIADRLYRAASKAAARTHPLFRDTRSRIVVGNRVGLPRDAVDHMLEWAAAPECWFAESPAAAAVAPAAGGVAAAPPPPGGGGGAVGTALLASD